MKVLDNYGCNRAKSCKYLGVSRSKLYELVEAGEFPNAYKCGNQTMIPIMDLISFRERNRILTQLAENSAA